MSAGMQVIPQEHLLLTSEQDSAVDSLTAWEQLCGACTSSGLESTLHTPQHQLPVLSCQETGILGCLVALHATGTFVWKSKWRFQKSEHVEVSEK